MKHTPLFSWQPFLRASFANGESVVALCASASQAYALLCLVMLKRAHPIILAISSFDILKPDPTLLQSTVVLASTHDGLANASETIAVHILFLRITKV